MESFAASKPGLWVGRVMSTLFALFLLMDSTIKLVPIDAVTRTMTEMQLPATMARPIGIIELASLALYLWSRTAVRGRCCSRASSAAPSPATGGWAIRCSATCCSASIWAS